MFRSLCRVLCKLIDLLNGDLRVKPLVVSYESHFKAVCNNTGY